MPTTRPTHYKALLLGSSGSGKTELGHLLSGRPRDVDDQEQTNGVRCYRCRRRAPQDVELALTEVGGNADMQRLWPHYYASTHALIYCFNLAAGYAELQASFELLQRCLRHEALRGKAVLLVATRLSEGVQLYDVEHAFGLEALARSCGCPLHLCHLAEIADATDVWRGMDWLQRQLLQQSTTLLQRIKYDVNMQSWQQRSRAILSSGKLAQVRRQRFRRQHRKVGSCLLLFWYSQLYLMSHGLCSTALAADMAEESVMGVRLSRKGDVIFGWDVGLVPECITGVEKCGKNELWFLVRWKGCQTLEAVPAEIMNKKYPAVVIAFYEKHVRLL
ncbi:uncharacterized protein LOC115629919 [Scaptodrosophila lebanonensis]|uniref:Uncharacterized protein LOC115629919 n=1 Tax=Drosophila lebanonensis TaxID=7225 RepID=A0A6J2U4G6_DROLE|nr:uncharacterized protein LOC115629919 [Scaptodrosophila lebanonensis]